MITSKIKQKIDFSKYIHYIIVGYAFSLSISRACISIFTVLMILLWLIEGNFKRKFEQVKENKVIVFLVIFTLYTFISLFWTTLESLENGAGQSFKIVRLVILPILVIVTTLKKEYIPQVITAFLLGMLVSEIISYGIFFELWTWKHVTPTDPTPFMHHLDYSTFLAFTSLLLLNQFFTATNWRIKVFYFVYFLFVTSNLFINGGRTGQLAFVISLFVVGFVNIRNKIKAFIAMLFLVIFIFYCAYELSPTFNQRLYEATNEIYDIKNIGDERFKGSFGIRLGAWIVAIDMVKNNPLYGTGGGSEMVEFREYVKNSAPELQVVQILVHFHNEYVHIVVEYGIIGLILYLIIWYYLFKMPIENRSFSNLKVIFITVFSTASLVELIFHNQFPMSLFALFVGIFIVFSIDKKDNCRRNIE